MLKKYISIVGLLIILFYQCYGQNYNTTITPERIILNLTVNPSNSMAVTWRTVGEVKKPQVRFAEASDWIEFAKNAKAIDATTEKIQLDNKQNVYYYSAVMNELKPNKIYAYRVGGDLTWSEWNQFTTAENKNAPFKFVFFGDPQNDIKEHVSRVFREAFMKVPDAKFWLFSGDITSEPEDEQVEGLFYASGFIFRMIPSVMVPGNHDIAFKMENGIYVLNNKGKKEKTKLLPPTWRAQFTLPENGISGFQESSYYFDYQGVRIFMLNSNDRLEEQAAWMEKMLTDNPNKWVIASFHHPLYSAGGERDDKETRNAFLSVFDKYKVDLVLTGHDHAYARSYPLKNGVKVNDKEHGTVYVVSVSGPKMYEVNSEYSDIMAKTGGNVQLFQSISIDANRLLYNSYTPTGVLYDSFELVK
jgi:hypothetical protein